MTRMRYVKMDRIMNHMLIHALREMFRQEKESAASDLNLHLFRRGTESAEQIGFRDFRF